MEISPAFLEFKSPFTTPSTELLTLTNTTDKVLAFKVKTTAPKVYCVRPNAAIVQPGESLDVSIILQGLKEEPKPDYKCKDKFLVVTLPCPYDLDETKQTVSQLWPTLEKQYKEQSVSKKIRVVFKISETKAPIVEKEAPTLVKSEPSNVEKQSPVSEKTENVKSEKVEPTSTTATAADSTSSTSGLNMTVISLLVVLIAFLFWLLF